VRLSGCNLRCSWCDTPHAFYGGTRLPLEDVIEQALARSTALVEITGGEPLLQPGVLPLMRTLADRGRTVLLETSGERDVSEVDERVHRIVDLKTPSSGESSRNRWENLAFLGKRDEVKFVMADRADYEWTRDVIVRERLSTRVGHVLLSCVFDRLAAQDVVKWMLEDRLEARFQLQMHKHIWDPASTGV